MDPWCYWLWFKCIYSLSPPPLCLSLHPCFFYSWLSGAPQLWCLFPQHLVLLFSKRFLGFHALAQKLTPFSYCFGGWQWTETPFIGFSSRETGEYVIQYLKSISWLLIRISLLMGMLSNLPELTLVMRFCLAVLRLGSVLEKKCRLMKLILIIFSCLCYIHLFTFASELSVLSTKNNNNLCLLLCITIKRSLSSHECLLCDRHFAKHFNILSHLS